MKKFRISYILETSLSEEDIMSTMGGYEDVKIEEIKEPEPINLSINDKLEMDDKVG